MQSDKEMISNKVTAILSRIQQARIKFKIEHPVQLVAVSKTKTVEEIQEAYNCGVRHFGENYVDEIEQKAPKLPEDIKWHFIGHLQSNKIRKVLVPNLQYLQTVDRDSLAEKLQKELVKQNRQMKVLIQVKTSEEDSKSGVNPEELDKLYSYIAKECPHLLQEYKRDRFKGLMTIGQQGDIKAFGIMNHLKNQLCQKHQLKAEEFELSMGMSGDFQEAIQHGSTSVRVGSSIFGARNYKK